jgi:hypothetical protein
MSPVRGTALLPKEPNARIKHLLAELAILDRIPAGQTYPVQVDQIGPNSILNVQDADHRKRVRGRIVEALVKTISTDPQS